MINSKATFHDLVICGGKPAFSEKLCVNRPNLGNRELFINQIHSMLDSFHYTNDGPLVNKLEEQLAKFLNVKHCILATNGTAALALLIQALGLQGEVIIPSFSFISTAHTLLRQGIKPVFCDIDPLSWNIDPHHCESLITKHTSAIIGTHLWGRSCDIDHLGKIARQHNIFLLFDAAHAFGCTHQGKLIGGFGIAEVFSFHATKVFHTFEGGAVTSNDSDLVERIKTIRNFGFSDYDKVITLGTNAKMTEICAAMGLVNLQAVDHFFQVNRQVYDQYQHRLKNIPGISLLAYDATERNNYQYIVLEVDEEIIGLARDEIVDILHAENILARRYFYPGNHRMEPYRSMFPEADFELSTTNFIAHRVLLLPGGTGVTSHQIDEICNVLDLVVKNADKLPHYLIGKSVPALGAVTAGIKPQIAQVSGIIQRFLDKSGAQLRQLSTVPFKAPRASAPTVEIRIPISANEKFLRMVHYFLESLQEFGGPVGRKAHCVVSVSRDEPYRDLYQECPWAAEHSVEFQWLDSDLFDRLIYDGTGLHRLYVQSEADVVLLTDADLFVAGDFDSIIWESYRSQRLLGFIAHVSPFWVRPKLRKIPSHRWWNLIFEEAGLPRPRLNQVHTAWGLMCHDVRHRCCPYYFNYGVVVAPRVFVERMGETFEAELDAVDRVVETYYKSQIANVLTFARHGIPCATIPINYNFPLNMPGDQLRALNPDPEGANSPEDVKIFHYIRGGEVGLDHFATCKSLEKLLRQKDMSPYGSVLQRKIQIIHDKIMSGSNVTSVSS